MLKYFADQADQTQRDANAAAAKLADAQMALEDARAEAGDLVAAGLADMPTPVAEDMGLASTGVDMEVADGLMAIMAVVGAGCILVRRRIN